MSKRRLVGLALAALAIGVFVLAYRGPGRLIVRGHGGDVAATMLVFALLGFAWSSRVRCAIGALAIATVIEVGQTLWSARSFAAELTIGTTFDPYDFVAYVLGIAIAVVATIERGHDARHAPVRPRAVADRL